MLGGAGNDTLNENAPLAADGTPAYGVFGNGADALDGGSGEDTVDYGARTGRTVVNLGLISWFNDGADPNLDASTTSATTCSRRRRTSISGAANDLLSADYATTSRTTRRPPVPATTR